MSKKGDINVLISVSREELDLLSFLSDELKTTPPMLIREWIESELDSLSVLYKIIQEKQEVI